MIIGEQTLVDTYSMINGLKSYEALPDGLWAFFTKTLYLYFSSKYKEDKELVKQPWALVPDAYRQWVSLGKLADSFFVKKDNIIMLDFDRAEPILTTGSYCLKTITELKECGDQRNIYMFDMNMNIFVFYIEDGGILVEGNSALIKRLVDS